MKIRYINEAFKKISDLKKDIDKHLSDEDIRISSVKDLLYPMFNDERFQKICSNCFSRFIKGPVSTSAYQGLVNFRFESIEDDILNLSLEHYYFSETDSKDSVASNIYIFNDEIKSRTAEEINEFIDEHITKQFKRWCINKDDIILNSITKIHINKIFLYANAPENINGVYPWKVTMHVMQRESDEDLLSIFEKLSQIFVFCIKYPVVSTNIIKLEKIDPGKSKYRIPEISKILSRMKKIQRKDDDPYIVLKRYINSEKIQEYELSLLWIELDLHKYLTYKNIEKAEIVSGKLSKDTEKYIITNADAGFLEKNKEFIKAKLDEATVSSYNELGDMVKDTEFFAGAYFEYVISYNIKDQSYDSMNTYIIVPYAYGKYTGTCNLR